MALQHAVEADGRHRHRCRTRLIRAELKEPKENGRVRIARRKKETEPLKRHHVGFIKVFELEKLPQEAYATLGASQAFSLSVNGKEVGPMMSDSPRRCTT